MGINREIDLLGKTTFCLVYIFVYFIHLPSAPCGFIWTNFLDLSILLPCQLAQFCYPAIKANFESKITCLHYNYSTSNGQFNNRIYFTFLSHLQANGRNLKHKNVFMFQRIWILIASKLIFCLDKTPTYLGSSSSINNSVWLCRWTVV